MAADRFRPGAGVGRLHAATEAVDHQEEHVSERDLLGYLDDPDADYPRGSVAVYDGDLMIAFGQLFSRTAAEPVHEMRMSGGVHPGQPGVRHRHRAAELGRAVA
jgi:mycothiol synthase